MPEPILIDSVKIRKNTIGGRGKGEVASKIRIGIFLRPKKYKRLCSF